VNVDASEIFALALDLSTASGKIVAPLREAFTEAGDAAARQWYANARATSGRHGKWYPSSIDAETKFTLGGNVEVEVGPNAAKKQGRMGRGFEFGSVNQPPHLDGVRAFEAVEPRVAKIADEAVARLLP
jgi:hypothetical protein